MAIKFVSLNMWDGGVLMEELLHFLKQEDADIIALQEVYNGTAPHLPARHRSLQTLLAHLPHTHHRFVADYLEKDSRGARYQRGNAILSKFPITKDGAVFYDKPYSEDYIDSTENNHNLPRHIQHALIHTPDALLDVFNIHGVWDLDGDNFGVGRQKMSQAMLDSIKDKQNVILAGDTNARPSNQAIKNLHPHLKDVFAGDLKTTFNMRRKDHPGYASSVVDMIFTSHHAKVISKRCPQTDISDHLPLVATLAL